MKARFSETARVVRSFREGRLGDGVRDLVGVGILGLTLSVLAAACDSAVEVSGPEAGPPEAGVVMVETGKNDPLTVSLVGTDRVGEGLQFRVVEGPDHGTLSGITHEGLTGATVTYGPDEGFSGTDGFTYEVEDGEQRTATGQVTIEVVNTAPEALSASVVRPAAGDAVTIELRGRDADGDALTFSILTAPAGGSLGQIRVVGTESVSGAESQAEPVSAGDGFDGALQAGEPLITVAEVDYTPDPDVDGGDSFTFGVNDGDTDSSDSGQRGQVEIEANEPPSPADVTVETGRDAPVQVPLTAEDGDGDALIFTIAEGPANGSLGEIEPLDGNDAVVAMVEYTPDEGFVGEDAFTVRVSDGMDEAEARVEVEVNNGAPVAVPAEAHAARGGEVEITLSGYDPDGDPLTFEIAEAPSNGGEIVSGPDLVDATSATVIYRAPGSGTRDGFHFRVSDGVDDATAPVTVAFANEAPTVVSAEAPRAALGSTVTVTLEGQDPDGDALTFQVVSGPSAGSLGPVSSSGRTTATVDLTAPGAGGPVTFEVAASDGTTDSEPFTVTVQVNHRPVAGGQTAETGKDAPVVLELRATDDDGDELTLDIESGPEHGALSGLTATGPGTAEVLYTPDAGFTGTDRFDFVADDGLDASAAATVTITVVNTAPTADPGAGSVDEDARPVTLTLTGSEPDGEALSFSIATPPTNGTLEGVTTLDATTAEVDYTPDPDFFGDDPFDFTVEDGSGATSTATVTVTVTPVNDAPSFTSGGAVTVLEDAGAVSQAWATDVSAGPANEAGQTLSFDASNDNNGLFSAQPAISTAGELTFTPAADANGSATVTVSLSDDGGTANGGVDTSPEQTFTITVEPVNDAPSFTKGPDITVDEDSGPFSQADWATDISTGPADEAGQTVQAYNVSNDNNALFAAQPAITTAGELTFTPAADANGTATVTLSLSDDGGTANGGVDTSAEQTFTITVDPVNDPPDPVATPTESFTTAGNTTLQLASTRTVTPSVFVSGNLLDNFTDAEGDALTAGLAAASVTTGADVTVNADGTFTYTPPVGRTTDDTFDYTVTDGTDPVTRTVTVSMQDMVWYVDNTGGGDGRSSAPFTTTTAAATASGAGEVIFVHAGDGSVLDAGFLGLRLKNDQRLIGEAAGLTLTGLGEIVPAGSRPVLGGGLQASLFLADDNEVRGLKVDASGSVGAILGSNGTGGVIDEVEAIGGSANALKLVSWTGTVTITATRLEGGGPLTVSLGDPVISFEGTLIQSGGGENLIRVDGTTGGSVTIAPGTGGEITGNPSRGIFISDAAGDVTVTGARLSGTTTFPAVNVSGGSGTFTFDDLHIEGSGEEAVKIDGGSATVNVNLAPTTLSHSAASPAVLVQNFGGTATFTGGPITVTGGGGGISLANNTGGTVEFQNEISLNTGASAAIAVTGDGAATFGDVTILERDGTAIDIDGTSGDVTFGALTIANPNGSTAPAITVDGTTGGTVTFDGAHDIDGGGAGGGTDALVGFARSSANAGVIDWTGGTIQNAGGYLVRSENATKVRMTDVTLDGGEFGIAIVGGGEWDLSGLTVRGIQKNGVFAQTGAPVVLVTNSSFEETGLGGNVAPAVAMNGTTDGHLVLEGLTFGTRDRSVMGATDRDSDAMCVALTNLTPDDPLDPEYILNNLAGGEFELEPVTNVTGTIKKSGTVTDVAAGTCTRPNF